MRVIVRTTVLLVLASVAPAFSQGLDVRSLPGDTPGEKVPFQFSSYTAVVPQQAPWLLIPVPQGTALTIETITVRAFSSPNSIPNVRIWTALGAVSTPIVTAPEWARHIVALVRKGPLTSDSATPVYEATHAVRLHHRSSVAPRFELWNQGSEGTIVFYVSVAGYVTATRTSSSEPAVADGSRLDQGGPLPLTPYF